MIIYFYIYIIIFQFHLIYKRDNYIRLLESRVLLLVVLMPYQNFYHISYNANSYSNLLP